MLGTLRKLCRGERGFDKERQKQDREFAILADERDGLKRQVDELKDDRQWQRDQIAVLKDRVFGRDDEIARLNEELAAVKGDLAAAEELLDEAGQCIDAHWSTLNMAVDLLGEKNAKLDRIAELFQS